MNTPVRSVEVCPRDESHIALCVADEASGWRTEEVALAIGLEEDYDGTPVLDLSSHEEKMDGEMFGLTCIRSEKEAVAPIRQAAGKVVAGYESRLAAAKPASTDKRQGSVRPVFASLSVQGKNCRPPLGRPTVRKG